MKIVVVGTGYVGLVSGSCLAELGHHVTCVDIDKQKISNLKKGIMPIHEDGLESLVLRNVQNGRLHFHSSLQEVLEDATSVFIAVGTPPNEDGSADLKYVLDVAAEVANHMNSYKLVIVKSTVPVGTVHKVKNIIQKTLHSRNSKVEFDVASNPEFLKEGAAINDFMQPDRIVAGVENERAAHVIRELFEPLTDEGYPLIMMDICSSEITKYAANSMLALRISFMNELAQLCEKSGADIEEVRKGIGSDTRIGKKFLAAGLGYGGSCFPKDVQALINTMQEKGLLSRILESVHEVNTQQRYLFINKIIDRFSEFKDSITLAVWGLAFKPGTDDVREAASVTIIEKLIEEGFSIRVYDPIAMQNFKTYSFAKKIYYANDMYDAVKGADALLLVTEWDEFLKPNFDFLFKNLNQKIIFDGRNVFNLDVMNELEVEYYPVGREKRSTRQEHYYSAENKLEERAKIIIQ